MAETGSSNPTPWISHALRQAPWRTQTQATTLVLTVVVFVVVIGALYLAQASRTAAAGRKLQELEAERQILEQQNAQLRADIATLRSVPRLMAAAEERGYHLATVNEVIYIVIEDVPPIPSPDETAPLTLADIVPQYDDSLEGWLREGFTGIRTQFGRFWERTFGNGSEGGDEELPGEGN